MKYYSRLDVYRTSNNEVSLTSQRAYSYGWWKYWTVDNGISIFNNTYYSQSTCKHQREALKLIREPDLILYHTKESLGNPAKALQNEVDGMQYEIRQLEKAITRPRSHKAKNEERYQKIKEYQERIERIKDTLEQLYKEAV